MAPSVAVIPAPIAITSDGELKAKLNVKAHAFSKSAVEAIEAKKGTVELIGLK